VSTLVAGFGVPHTPAFPSLVKHERGPWREVAELYAAVADRVADAQLDALVVFSSDHFNTFFLDCYPTFAIGVADETSGPNDSIPDLPPAPIPVHRQLARAVVETVIEEGFDVAVCERFEVDHTFAVPLHFLFGEPPPIVPVFINSFVAPQPSAHRAFELGRAVGKAVEREGDLRVGVLATGSFSLEVGGPRSSDTDIWGVPDPDWAARATDLLRDGNVEGLIRESTREQIAAAGNASAEVLDWIAMLGATGAREPVFLELQPRMGHAYGAWPL
jgi:aromatic ring-opening dioxygenase catalytic subunit (LigB family)